MHLKIENHIPMVQIITREKWAEKVQHEILYP